MNLENNIIKDKPTISRKWLSFIFEHKGNQIIVRNGSLNPVAEIWVNDNLVHTERNWKLVMDQTITIPSGEEINIRFGYNKFGSIFMTAKSNSFTIYDYQGQKDLKMWLYLLPLLLLGGFSGYYLATYFLG